jgi:pimeloyl-ACP methyl ester carboxylesterase
MTGGVRIRSGGSGQQVLLLLHGLGATSEVWNPSRALLTHGWQGRWLAPDLPGHGGSEPLAEYSFDALAKRVAGVLSADDRMVILGHSLGGVVGLALAGGRFNLPVGAVIGLGIKVAWTAEELAKARALAERPVAWFPSQAEAAARYLRVSGLTGLIDEDDPAVSAGLRQERGRWRLAMDPAAFGVGAPDMPALLAGCRSQVLLARGERDPMVSDAQLAELNAPSTTLGNLGHNAHVEDPAAVLRLLHPYR